MNKFFTTAFLTATLGGLLTVQAQDGFVIYGKDGNCDSELTYRAMKDGKLQKEQVAVKKGEGGDIHVHISYDGVWIAFSRSTTTWSTKHGGCDYHTSDNFDMYIAKIDNGKNLPAKAIKVGHGFWSSWGKDATDPNKPKTLYYSHFKDRSIMKTVIQPDGSFSTPEKYFKVPGRIFHSGTSPDGKYVAYRPSGINVADVATGKDVKGAGGAGCHPSWGPRSKYLIWARNNVCRIDGGTGKKIGSAGLGAYWYGISNDAYYDKGKLWVIGKMTGGKTQNDAGSVEFKEVDISGGGWKPSKNSTKVGSGASCDIHIYGPNGPSTGISNKTQVNQIAKVNFDALVTTGKAGLQLVITAKDLTGSSLAELFNMQGKKVASMRMSTSLQNIMPLNSITNGNYILKMSTNNISTQKTIWISQ